MKKGSTFAVLMLAFCCIAWAGGWATDILANNVKFTGKLFSTQNTAPKYDTGGGATTCGISPSIKTGSSDSIGQITLGTGSVTGCKVTFDSVYTTAPTCLIYPTGTTVIVATTDTTGIYMSSATSVTTYKVNWFCAGNY